LGKASRKNREKKLKQNLISIFTELLWEEPTLDYLKLRDKVNKEIKRWRVSYHRKLKILSQ
jgi:hypothetical protein